MHAKDKNPIEFRVGGQFPFELPIDSVIFEWRKDLPPTLICAWESPTKNEVHAFKKTLKFAVSEYDGLLFLLIKTDRMDWAGAAFDINLYSDEMKPEPIFEFTESTRINFSLILVDTRTKIVKSLKSSTLSPKATQVLTEIIAKQRATPDRERGRSLEKAYALQGIKFEENLAKKGVICKAGD